MLATLILYFTATGALGLAATAAVHQYQKLRREDELKAAYQRGQQDRTFVPPMIAERVRRLNRTPRIGRPVLGRTVPAFDELHHRPRSPSPPNEAPSIDRPSTRPKIKRPSMGRI